MNTLKYTLDGVVFGAIYPFIPLYINDIPAPNKKRIILQGILIIIPCIIIGAGSGMVQGMFIDFRGTV